MSFFFVCLLGCNDEETVKVVEKPFEPTHGGHLIKFHTDAPGQNTQVGDLVYYHIRHRNKNTVTYSSRRMGVNEPFKYLITQLKPGTTIPPILVGLLQMSPGDSITLRVDVSENIFKEPGYENAKYKDLDISLQRIEKNVDPIIFNAMQRVIEPQDFNQEIDYNSATDEVSKSSKGLTADGLWTDVMHKKLKELLYELGNKYRAGELSNTLLRLPSGLQYMVLDPGSNKSIGFSKNVWLKYFGSNMEGRPFDKKYQKNKVEEIELGSGQLISGLEEGISQLNEGGSGIFFIPANLAYGSKGTDKVEPNAQFVVYYAKVDRFY